MDDLQLITNNVNLLRGSSYIKLYSDVKKKHVLVVINVQNTNKSYFKQFYQNKTKKKTDFR